MNVDASVHLAQHRAYSGVVIRDNHGEVMGACRKLTWPVSSVFLAEARAMVHGLQFAEDLGFQNVILGPPSERLTAQRMTYRR